MQGIRSFKAQSKDPQQLGTDMAHDDLVRQIQYTPMQLKLKQA